MVTRSDVPSPATLAAKTFVAVVSASAEGVCCHCAGPKGGNFRLAASDRWVLAVMTLVRSTAILGVTDGI
jgi:hypothetical protein